MKPQHLALMLLICAIWGGNFVVSKLAVGHFPPVLFTALRFALLALLMVPWLKWKPGQMGSVLLAALCMGTLHFALIIIGIAKADESPLGPKTAGKKSGCSLPSTTLQSVTAKGPPRR